MQALKLGVTRSLGLEAKLQQLSDEELYLFAVLHGYLEPPPEMGYLLLS